MRAITEKLYEAQRELLRLPLGSPRWRSSVEKLRASIPAPILAHFLRLLGTGETGVALVRHGVCGQCHIRVCFGLLAALRDPKDLHLCDHCGRYLLLPADELTAPTPPSPAAKAPRRTKRVPVLAT